jgi:hypothetical protein
VVAKRVDQPYRAGLRAWQKVKPRVTAEALVGGVTGPINAEVSADLAMDGPRWRHPVRFVRVRGDLTAADLTGEMRAVDDGS